MTDRFVYYLDQFFARDPFCLRKIITGPHNLVHGNADCPDDRNPNADCPDDRNPNADCPDDRNPNADSPDDRNPNADCPDDRNPNADCPDDRNPKLKSYTSELILCRYKIHSSSTCNNALHDLTFIKMICRSLRGSFI